MIRAPQTGSGDNSGGSQSKGQRRQNAGFPYIKNENLSTDKKLVKVIDVRENQTQTGQANNRFSDYIVKCSMSGQTWLLGLRITNPVFKALYDAFGPDENGWVSKKFYLYLEEDEFSGKYWMRADTTVSEEEPKKANRR